MAERSHWWIERWLMSPLFLSLSLSLSVSFSDYLPTYPPIYLSTYLSIYQCNHPCNDQLFNHPALLRIEKWFKNGTSLLNHPVKDGGAATTKITPMPLPVRKCIATAMVTVNNQLRSKRSSHFVALRSKVHKKVMPGHTKCCTCHAKWPQQTWRSDAPN